MYGRGGRGNKQKCYQKTAVPSLLQAFLSRSCRREQVLHIGFVGETNAICCIARVKEGKDDEISGYHNDDDDENDDAERPWTGTVTVTVGETGPFV